KEGGTSRTKAVTTLAESLGGSLESYYFAFGDDSYFVVVDLPNDEAAAACALVVAASGAVSNSTIKLLTPAQVDAAIKLSPNYRAPGQ
ncbi:MAG: GYD domain-containing protein, partial [Chloroflexota bacterium]